MPVTLDAGPLARCQCPKGPATDHLDTGFLSRFPCVLKANGGSQISKMSLHASHVAPTDVNVNFISTVSSTCICVYNHCHRAKDQLQLNKYYY